MYKGTYKIYSNEKIANNVFKMVILGNTESITNSGQFINISLKPFYLRRPISICDYDKDSITIIYKIVGKGTEYMSKLKKGDELDILCGLGNGYNIDIDAKQPLIIGGGVGTPPLYNLAKRLIKKDLTPQVILGFNTADEVFLVNEFKELGCEIQVATVDGSYGSKGFVTDIMPSKNKYDYIFACGSLVMLKAVCNAVEVSGQISLEERMGCGFGACMGCSIKTKQGFKRVCKDGPVFEKDDIIW